MKNSRSSRVRLRHRSNDKIRMELREIRAHVANEKSRRWLFRVWNGEKCRSDREWRRVWVVAAEYEEIEIFLFFTRALITSQSRRRRSDRFERCRNSRKTECCDEDWETFSYSEFSSHEKLKKKDEKNFSLSPLSLVSDSNTQLMVLWSHLCSGVSARVWSWSWEGVGLREIEWIFARERQSVFKNRHEMCIQHSRVVRRRIFRSN